VKPFSHILYMLFNYYNYTDYKLITAAARQIVTWDLRHLLLYDRDPCVLQICFHIELNFPIFLICRLSTSLPFGTQSKKLKPRLDNRFTVDGGHTKSSDLGIRSSISMRLLSALIWTIIIVIAPILYLNCIINVWRLVYIETQPSTRCYLSLAVWKIVIQL
jgi:hypothetical protein